MWLVRQDVIYENIPPSSSSCGSVGHAVSGCPKNHPRAGAGVFGHVHSGCKKTQSIPSQVSEHVNTQSQLKKRGRCQPNPTRRDDRTSCLGPSRKRKEREERKVKHFFPCNRQLLVRLITFSHVDIGYPTGHLVSISVIPYLSS